MMIGNRQEEGRIFIIRLHVVRKSQLMDWQLRNQLLTNWSVDETS